MSKAIDDYAEEQRLRITLKHVVWNKCRKKPVVVDFCCPAVALRIKTLEGRHDYDPTKDVLIKGIKGELYPCKKVIFNETYKVLID